MSAPTSPPMSPPRHCGKQMTCTVHFLDDSTHTFRIPMKSNGQVLFDQVVRKLRLLESDYFDLSYVDVRGNTCWLDRDKAILRQLPHHNLELSFVVKFYMPDPGLLEEEYTRYLFTLQIKRDLLTGAMPCQDHTAALLASYIAQAEFGDYTEDDFGPDPSYSKFFNLLPHPTEELRTRMMNHHKEHFGQSPAIAEYNLLDTARKVELYGIRMHPAKDHEGVPLQLSVAHMGVLVFQSFVKINTFSWAKIRKLSFKRKKFLVKLHPEGYGYYKDTVEFYFDSRNSCKNFWKRCIEHHAFYRCQSVRRLPRNRPRVVSRGSSFRYSGRTQKELLEYVRENSVKRPEFHRSTSMRTMSAGATPRTGTLNSIRSHRATSAPGRASSAGRALAGTPGSGPGISADVEQDEHRQQQRRSATLENETRRIKNSSSIDAVHASHKQQTHSKSLQQISDRAPAAVSDVIKPSRNGSVGQSDVAAAELRHHYHQQQQQQQQQSLNGTLPSTHKTTVDDFNCIYDDDIDRRRRRRCEQSLDRLEQIAANNAEQLEERRRLRNEDDSVLRDCSSRGVRRSDNLSQDSYRVTDSRDSSLDRLDRDDCIDDATDHLEQEMLPPPPPIACSDAIERMSAPLDDVRLMKQLERERQLQEEREKSAVDDINSQQQQRESNVDVDLDTCQVRAEWDVPEHDVITERQHHRHSEIETVVCIEMTRIVQTVETTTLTTTTNVSNSNTAAAVTTETQSIYDLKRKRLSRENAVRVIDEDLQNTSPAGEQVEQIYDTVEQEPIPELEQNTELKAIVTNNDEQTVNAISANSTEDHVASATTPISTDEVAPTETPNDSGETPAMNDTGSNREEVEINQQHQTVSVEGEKVIEEYPLELHDEVDSSKSPAKFDGMEQVNEETGEIDQVPADEDGVKQADELYRQQETQLANGPRNEDNVSPLVNAENTDALAPELDANVASLTESESSVPRDEFATVGRKETNGVKIMEGSPTSIENPLEGGDVVQLTLNVSTDEQVRSESEQIAVELTESETLSQSTAELEQMTAENVDVGEKTVQQQSPVSPSQNVTVDDLAKPAEDDALVSIVTDLLPKTDDSEMIEVQNGDQQPKEDVDNVQADSTAENEENANNIRIDKTEPKVVEKLTPENVQLPSSAEKKPSEGGLNTVGGGFDDDDEIPYVLHKRTVRPTSVHRTNAGIYSTLPSDAGSSALSRSRSPSPCRRFQLPVVPLTREQKRAQMEKVKASLLSMAANLSTVMRSPRSPGSKTGPLASWPPGKPVIGFVLCSRLPPRDSFSSVDDSVSPPHEHSRLLVHGKTDAKVQTPTESRDEERCGKTVCDSDHPTVARLGSDDGQNVTRDECTDTLGVSGSIEIVHKEYQTTEGSAISQLEGSAAEERTENVLDGEKASDRKVDNNSQLMADRTVDNNSQLMADSSPHENIGSNVGEIQSAAITGPEVTTNALELQEKEGNPDKHGEMTLKMDHSSNVDQQLFSSCIETEEILTTECSKNNSQVTATVESDGVELQPGENCETDIVQPSDETQQLVRTSLDPSQPEAALSPETEDDINQILSECDDDAHEPEADESGSIGSMLSAKFPNDDDVLPSPTISPEVHSNCDSKDSSKLQNQSTETTQPSQTTDDPELDLPPPPDFIDADLAVETHGLAVPEIIVRVASDVDLRAAGETVAITSNGWKKQTDVDDPDIVVVPDDLTKTAPLASDPVGSPPLLQSIAKPETDDDDDELGQTEQQLLRELRGESDVNINNNNGANDVTADDLKYYQQQQQPQQQQVDGMSTSSRSLNDELDADAMQTAAACAVAACAEGGHEGGTGSAVDAACRLSESSFDGNQAAAGFSRQGHVIEWLQEQAQIMRATLPISDDDEEDEDVNRPVFDGNLDDVMAALEAEAEMLPFHVGRQQINSDNDCHRPLDDVSSVVARDSELPQDRAEGHTGKEEPRATDNVHESTDAHAVTGQTGPPLPLRMSDGSGNNNSTLSLSISSEGDIEQGQPDDLPDPLEILELEAAAVTQHQLMSSAADVWKSAPFDSDSSSEGGGDVGGGESGTATEQPDVADILDSAGMATARATDAGVAQHLRQRSLTEDACALQPDTSSVTLPDLSLTASDVPVQLPPVDPTISDTSSTESSTAPVCNDEPDALAALDDEDEFMSSPLKQRQLDVQSDNDEGCVEPDPDAIDSESSSQGTLSPSALDTFVHQVMKLQSSHDESSLCSESTSQQLKPNSEQSVPTQCQVPADATDNTRTVNVDSSSSSPSSPQVAVDNLNELSRAIVQTAVAAATAFQEQQVVKEMTSYAENYVRQLVELCAMSESRASNASPSSFQRLPSEEVPPSSAAKLPGQQRNNGEVHADDKSSAAEAAAEAAQNDHQLMGDHSDLDDPLSGDLDANPRPLADTVDNDDAAAAAAANDAVNTGDISAPVSADQSSPNDDLLPAHHGNEDDHDDGVENSQPNSRSPSNRHDQRLTHATGEPVCMPAAVERADIASFQSDLVSDCFELDAAKLSSPLPDDVELSVEKDSFRTACTLALADTTTSNSQPDSVTNTDVSGELTVESISVEALYCDPNSDSPKSPTDCSSGDITEFQSSQI